MEPHTGVFLCSQCVIREGTDCLMLQLRRDEVLQPSPIPGFRVRWSRRLIAAEHSPRSITSYKTIGIPCMHIHNSHEGLPPQCQCRESLTFASVIIAHA